MVTTAYNFKQWFKRHYPDITINPIYGLEAYTFDKPLNPEHMYEYNVQQLPSGLYIVFIGRSPEQVLELMRTISREGIQYVRPKRAIPTTFSSFENWYRTRQLKPLHRTHCAKVTANELLSTDKPEWNTKRDWYMYEFRTDDETFKEPLDFGGPHVFTESGTVTLLVKASTNSYVSKKQLFLQRFALMQPLLEQVISACAQDDWSKAMETAAQYASIQFDAEVVVARLEDMKAAYDKHELALFLRCRSNFTEVADGGF